MKDTGPYRTPAECFQVMYDTHAKAVYKICLRLRRLGAIRESPPDVSDADDLYQEFFIAVWENEAQEFKQLSPGLIADRIRKANINLWRAANCQKRKPENGSQSKDAADPDSEGRHNIIDSCAVQQYLAQNKHNEKISALYEAAEKLSSKDRQIFELFVKGLSLQQMGEMLGIKPATVWAQKDSMVRRIKQLLDPPPSPSK